MENRKFRVEITRGIPNADGISEFVFDCVSTAENNFNDNLLRGEVRINEVQGAYRDNCSISIYGLSLKTLSDLTFITWNSQKAVDFRNKVRVKVGEYTVYEGEIYRAFADFSEAPDVCLRITGVFGLYIASKTSTDKVFLAKDKVKVTDAFNTLAAEGGLATVFSEKVKDMLCPDITLSGSLEKQIETLVKGLGLKYNLIEGKLYVWAQDEDVPQAPTIKVDFQNGLIGYPTFWDCGVRFRGIFKPELKPGNIIELNSIVPGTILPEGKPREYLLMAKSSTISTLPNGQWASEYNCFFRNKN